MCLYMKKKKAALTKPRPFEAKNALCPLILLMFFIFISPAIAMNYSDEYLYAQNWQLPDSAIDMTELAMKDDLLNSGEIPFSGWVCEHDKNGSILYAISYKQGKKDGSGLFWYPDGKPMMSVYYIQNAPHGRFLGWYPDGRTIYDLVLNQGKFASDLLMGDDDSRLHSGGEIYEQEGSDNDSIRE